MKKREKNKIVQGKDIHKAQQIKQSDSKNRMNQEWSDLMDSPQKKLSEGALFIFRIKRTRNHWGNKQLWGSKEKGRHKPGHKTPKTKKT
jgi:hypothetical protein